MKSLIRILSVLIVFVVAFGGFQMTVLAEENIEVVDKNLIKLPREIMKSESVHNFTDIILSEDDNCFYAVGSNRLYRYDFLTNEYEVIEAYNYTEDMRLCDRYIANGKIYLVLCKHYWSASEPFRSEILCFDLKTQIMSRVECVNERITAFGVDDCGRMYLAGERASTDDESGFLRLLDSVGSTLDEVGIEDEVYEFIGFDKERGTFYTNSYFEYYSWGYTHDGNVVRVGSVDENNKISYDSNIVKIISQRGVYDRPKQTELIGNDYLAIDATLNKRFYIVRREEFVNSAGTSGVTISVPHKFEYNAFDSCGVLGTRCLYFEESDSLFFCFDDKTVMEYEPNTAESVGLFNTQHNVYAMYEFKDNLLLFEKENEDFYYCFIEIDRPERIMASSDEVNIKVGEHLKIEANVDGIYIPELSWESDNPFVATVNEYGTVVGWSEGTTNITISSKNVSNVKVRVNVTENSSYNEQAFNVKDNIKSRIVNQGDNNYAMYASCVRSYLNENIDGSFTVVNAGDGKVYVDTYSEDFSQLRESVELECPLALFGGYYSGEKYNYLVSGNLNENESNDVEVIRVDKYSKDFELIDSLSICGENTYIAFDIGALRMVESDGLLYVHTCHEMYVGSDDLRHQANMSFVMDTETTELVCVNSDVSSLYGDGYVSHSFNQFVITDGEYIYRIDQGDAAPRGVSISKSPAGEVLKNIDCMVVVEFEGMQGDNHTGASIGGVECSRGNILVAGNIYADVENMWPGSRNIFLSVTQKDFSNSKLVTITDYDANGYITGLTPHLVKINDEQFLLMWEELNDEVFGEYIYKTKMVTVDSSGTLTSNVTEIPYRLSDCKPIVASDGTVKWFVSDENKTFLCSVNPFKLNEVENIVAPDKDLSTDHEEVPRILGDVDRDGVVTVKDATLLQKYLAKILAINENDILLADVNFDKKYTISDATLIQKYVAKIIIVF